MAEKKSQNRKRVPLSEISPEKKANDLNGRDWTKYSLSVWRDIKWSAEERALKHPAMFPIMLAERLIKCFTKSTELEILDPFMGSGSALIAAHNLDRHGIGFDVYDKYIRLAKSRFNQASLFGEDKRDPTFVHADSRKVAERLGKECIDFCLTSPPYWNILKQKRTADSKEIRNYGDDESDLGTIDDYNGFIDSLAEVFSGVFDVLRPKKYCAVNVMDLRKQDQFFPIHCDLAKRLERIGFIFDDIIIWDRRDDYNNLRSLGYPYVFRINKIHEYILVFKKPTS